MFLNLEELLPIHYKIQPTNPVYHNYLLLFFCMYHIGPFTFTKSSLHHLLDWILNFFTFWNYYSVIVLHFCNMNKSSIIIAETPVICLVKQCGTLSYNDLLIFFSIDWLFLLCWMVQSLVSQVLALPIPRPTASKEMELGIRHRWPKFCLKAVPRKVKITLEVEVLIFFAFVLYKYHCIKLPLCNAMIKIMLSCTGWYNISPLKKKKVWIWYSQNESFCSLGIP